MECERVIIRYKEIKERLSTSIDNLNTTKNIISKRKYYDG